MTIGFADLEQRVNDGRHIGREDAERVLASGDLISVGLIGEASRVRRSGHEVTFGRVCEVGPAAVPARRGDAGEVRLTGTPSSIDDACAGVAAALTIASGSVLTGFSAADLLAICGGDHLALADAAARLAAAGLNAIAECPLDRASTADDVIETVRALREGGLGVWRLTVDRASLGQRLDLAERAAEVQRIAGGIRALAPLPRRDPVDTPSTGYDDVRTIAVTSLLCPEIPFIQVDWPLYGPKLAQVAVAYGANDIDGVAAEDTLGLGARRSPREEIERQIRAAAGVPVERDGRYERRS